MTRQPPGLRDNYRRFFAVTPRWNDNDVFGHVNNAEYYGFFDTAVVRFLIEGGVLAADGSGQAVVVAESGCRFHREVVFTDRVEIGVRLERIGTSSVRYRLGVFTNEDAEAAAEGFFVHVFVDRGSKRPTPIPERFRGHFEKLS
jgi:acyl-CoA thioester hydrolase